jgi:tRNA pseudouridine38-40 synthase
VYQALTRDPLRGRFSWHVRPALDGEALRQAAALILGEHDFAGFGTPTSGTSTHRVIFQSGWTAQPLEQGMEWVYRVEGNSFLKHMVRRLVGVFVEVGHGRTSIEEFRAVLNCEGTLRRNPAAPGHGLTLVHVRYDEME